VERRTPLARLTEPVLSGTLDWMIVYIDANLYDHIEKGDRMPPEHRVPAEHCAAFRDARLSGRLSAYLSLTNVEELLGDWDRPERRPAAIRRLRHARDLVGFDSILKPPNILMAEAIRAYAEGLPAPSPYLLPGDEQRGRIIDMLTSVADGKDEYTGLVLETVAAVRAMKAGSKVEMENATRQARAGIATLPPAERTPSWANFRTDADHWALALAAHDGLADACRARGVDGLLGVRAVGLTVGAMQSMVYALSVERRAPRNGDGYDLWHAQQASAAEVFVTHDGELARRLNRIPVVGFTVVGSLWPIPPTDVSAGEHTTSARTS